MYKYIDKFACRWKYGQAATYASYRTHARTHARTHTRTHARTHVDECAGSSL
ncbi:hypothetical protein OAN61_00695 [bacterium]|nr:hypothetical protein [bacterium]